MLQTQNAARVFFPSNFNVTSFIIVLYVLRKGLGKLRLRCTLILGPVFYTTDVTRASFGEIVVDTYVVFEARG